MGLILYEDEDIIICRKPPGMSSEMGTSKTTDSFADFIREQTGRDIYVIHRLDVPTGGAIMYAKNEKAARVFSEIIARGFVMKEYLAVIDGEPESINGEMTDYLFRDKRKNKSYVVKRDRKGVKTARLTYSVLDTANGKSLVRIALITGRTHQIRAQFAARKTPVCGDGKYGSRDNGCEAALWSYRLSFIHPVKKTEITATSKPPLADYPWNLFDFQKTD